MSRLLYVVAAVAAIALSLVPLASARALRDGRSTQNCGHAVNCAIGVAIGQIDPPSGDPTQQPPKQGTTAYFTVETTVGQGPDPCSTIIVNGFVSGANPHSFGGTWKTLPDGQWGWIGGYTGGNLGRDNVTIDVKLSACSPPYGPYKFNDGDYTDAPEWKKSFGIGWFDFRDRGGCDSPQKWELGSRGGIDLYKQECVDDPVSEGAASFETEATDARLEAPGIPFTFSRRYDSIVANPGQLGYGWSDPFSSHLQINGSSSVFAYTATGQVIPFNTLGGGSYQPPPWTGATLSSTNGVYTLVEPDHTKWTYNSSGYLSAITAATGQQMTVSGSGGVVQSVTTANGKTITLTHNGSLELTKLALPDGREVDYGYDGAGNLTSVTDLRGGVTHYGYDQYHRLLTITDPMATRPSRTPTGLVAASRHRRTHLARRPATDGPRARARPKAAAALRRHRWRQQPTRAATSGRTPTPPTAFSFRGRIPSATRPRRAGTTPRSRRPTPTRSRRLPA